MVVLNAPSKIVCCLPSLPVHFHLCAALTEKCPSTFSFYFLPLNNIELFSCIRIGALHGLGLGIGVFSSPSEIKTFCKNRAETWKNWFCSTHKVVKSLIYLSNAYNKHKSHDTLFHMSSGLKLS